MSRFRIVIQRIDDDGPTERVTDLDQIDVPAPDARFLQKETAPDHLEAQTLARGCGKSHLHNLEPEDLVALTLEASAMARVPLAGTAWIPGLSGP